MNTLANLAHRLHEGEVQMLHALRHARRQRPAPQPGQLTPVTLTRGQRIADTVAATVGSWRFIITQSLVLIAWMVLNVIALVQHWDPYPFILLNLVLSFQAAYAAPFIMMSQNRQAAIDRAEAHNDYDINLKAELEIELLHQKIDLFRENEIMELTRLVRSLEDRLAALSPPPSTSQS